LEAKTFRGKHGGPERWWPSDPSFPPHGVADDHLLGTAVYNRGLCHSKAWRGFDWVADQPWQFATSVGRPIFIGESGCVESDACGGPPDDPNPPGTRKGQWFDDALVYMRDTGPSLGYTPLEAYCYSDVGFYRIDTSEVALEHFRTFANDPFFGSSDGEDERSH
jgi:hypothetical protein